MSEELKPCQCGNSVQWCSDYEGDAHPCHIIVCHSCGMTYDGVGILDINSIPESVEELRDLAIGNWNNRPVEDNLCAQLAEARKVEPVGDDLSNSKSIRGYLHRAKIPGEKNRYLYCLTDSEIEDMIRYNTSPPPQEGMVSVPVDLLADVYEYATRGDIVPRYLLEDINSLLKAAQGEG